LATLLPIALLLPANKPDGSRRQVSFLGDNLLSLTLLQSHKRGSATKEEVIVAKVDLAMNDFISDGWGFLRDRRPDTYGAITKKKDSRLSKKSKAILGRRKTAEKNSEVNAKGNPKTIRFSNASRVGEPLCCLACLAS